jgi:Uma2 family endonuclease
MVNILPTSPTQIAETWTIATWEEFLAVSESSETEKTRCYYDSGWMRTETLGAGSGHSQDNPLLSQVVSFYGIVKNLRVKGFTNGSFRRTGEQECQPDRAFYLGDDIPHPFPPKTTELVEVDRYGAPTLMIEIASTSLNDDLGRQRLLYKRLGVREYWVVDVLGAAILAFAIENQGSHQIQVSQVLPGLAISMIESALQRNQTQDDTEISRWLMQEFGAI